MAVKVELTSELLKHALEAYLASQKRLFNTTKQPAFKPIIDKDIAALQAALGSLEELPKK